MRVHEYPDSWGLVYGQEDGYDALVEVMVDEGVVAVFGEAKERPGGRPARPQLIELYFLQPYFSCCAATGLWQRGAQLVFDSREREERPLEERVQVRRPKPGRGAPEVPTAVVTCPTPRAGRREIRYPPANWQARFLPVAATVQGGEAAPLQRLLRGELATTQTLAIAQAVVEQGLGITDCSVMARLYLGADYQARKVAVAHLAQIFESEARGVLARAPGDPEPTDSQFVRIGTPGTDFGGMLGLSVAVKTWRGRLTLVGLPPAAVLAGLLLAGLGLAMPPVRLRVYPVLALPSELVELLPLLRREWGVPVGGAGGIREGTGGKLSG